MNYATSRQNEKAFANNVFKNFTDVVGGNPDELSAVLHNKFTVDDFAYSDDFNYFGYTQYMNKTIIPHKIAVYESGMELLKNPEIDVQLSSQSKEEFIYNLWIHDLSKFSADEIFGYANYNRETGSGKLQFEKAWHHHKMHNPHHPEYWLNPNRSGELEMLPIPNIYILEMIADWMGASKTYGSTLAEWMPQNLPKFRFINRSKVAELIRDFTGINVKMEERILIVE